MINTKKRRGLLIILAITLIVVACKKNTTTPPPTSSTPTSTSTPPTYSISFTDGSSKTFTLSPSIQSGITIYPINANFNYGTWISIPGNVNNWGYVYIAAPADSSNMYKLLTNVNYKIRYNYNPPLTQSLPDSCLGALSFIMNSPAGSDSTVNQNLTTTYYNKITSVTYIGRKYDTYNLIMSPQYVISGTFEALVRNDVTSQTRIFSNGKYNFVLGCRAQ